MANSGVGNKFVSVNLNKSYGQHQQPSKHHYHSHHSGSYGSNRARTVAGGGGGGGGMVVLSRPRSSQKAGPKLSVPPPLNLPSLRKEHERFDSLGPGGVPSSGGISGSGQRPSSSGMGWTKPGTVALQEKEGLVGGGGGGGDHVNDGVDQGLNTGDGVSRGSGGVYMPPSVRSGVSGPTSSVSVSAQVFPPLDKATVLRGEDFPSLQAALPIGLGAEKKQKDVSNQKQKQLAVEELSNDHRNGSRTSSVIDMRPQLHSGRSTGGFGLIENSGEGHGVSGSRLLEQGRKQDEYFPGPLPLVRLNPRSDWDDDERDTGQGFTDRGRDHGYSKTEAYWDGEFDMPRASVLPHKPARSLFDRWGQRDNETGRNASSEVAKLDPYCRDAKVPSREAREGNAWRASPPLPKEKTTGSLDLATDRNSSGTRSSSLNREKENKYIPSPFRDNAQDDKGRRDVDYGNGRRQAWNNSTDSFSSRGSDRNTRERYGNEQYNRYKADAFQNSSLSKPSFPLGGKDPALNFGREKRSLSKNEKPYLEDPFMKDFGATGFDGRDSFPGNLVGVVKRKKDMLKQTDFHDPVRESFEAELERVQMMQEQERQRIIEEQERALQQARREEEERLRLAREQEEKQRRLEEEAREAAWRAEQERLEAFRRAEEQRIAREEEKHRIFLEEERRKQAAKQKLLELEERIARRQAEAVKGGNDFSVGAMEKSSGMTKERDVSKATDAGDWEDSERMVDRITISASSDSSGPSRPFDLTSRPHFSNASSAFVDGGKPFNSWRRDAFENGNSSAFSASEQETENGHHSPRRDGSVGGRPFPRKEFYGTPQYMSSGPYHRAGVPEPNMDDFGRPKGQRWNGSGNGDHYGRNTEIESEYHENLAENYGDVTWGQHSHGNIYPPYSERFNNNPDGDGLYSFGRSRYSVRQPRVLPPLSLSSTQKTSYRGENEHSVPPTFLENQIQYNHATRGGSDMERVYDSGHQEDLGQHGVIDAQPENTDNEVQKVNGDAARPDSQSSVSVSSPPDSPIHLSHDDLDESGDSTVLSAEEGKEADLSRQEIEPLALPTQAAKENVQTASSSSSAGDDEEWTVDNHEHLQEQEEYEEDEDGYQEEDEVHEGGDGNIDLTREFDEMHLEDKESPDMMDHFVLGFNEGVEVGMPNDEYERNSMKEDSAYAITQISVGSLEEKVSFDSLPGDRKNLQSMDDPSQGSLDSSSRIFQESEKAMQDLVIQPNTGPQASTASEVMDHLDATGSTGVLGEHTLPYSVSMASHSSSGQSGVPTASIAPNQAEVPVKLQFGLFSGPSLIPSPVPAIQIGSIQMPLHLHPPVGPSLGQMHPSQPPLFQFGQLRYTSPISQGVLPLAPQSVSFIQPNVPANFSSNQNPRVLLPVQPSQDTSAHNLIKNEASSLLDNRSGLPSSLDLSHGNVSKEESSIPARQSGKSVVTQHVHVEIPNTGDNTASDSGFPSEDQGHQNSVRRNIKALSSSTPSEGEVQTVLAPSQSVSKEKDLNGLRGQTYSNRGKKYVFAVKGSNPRSAFLASEASHQESTGYQRRAPRPRTEFRIRENSDKKQSCGMVSSDLPNQAGLDGNSSANGRNTGFSARNGARKVVVVNKSKQIIESECSNSALGSSREMDSGNRNEKGLGKESSMRTQNFQHSGEGNLKRNIEEDADAPLQSGIVRVFEQHGIEAASDEDDFIEVRSKRQMLNDRRERREKEIKAKSRVAKPPRKPRPMPQNSTVSASSKRSPASANEVMNNVRSNFVATEGHNLANSELSAGFGTTIVSQPLAPIGTPAIKTDAQADIRMQAVKSLQTSSLSASAGPNLVSGFVFESKNKVPDNVQTSLGSWDNSLINQQVMTLTQTQLDDAMKPAQFDTCASIGDRTSSVTDPSMPSSSLLLKDKSFSSSSPINSLLAGEKIQFGAVTSPTVLPPSSRAVSHGIGPPGPPRSEIQIPRNLPASENDSLFFEKEKHTNESCVHLEDCEAEAAASAVAVAAITSDEIVRNGASHCTVSAADNKGFGGADIDAIAAGDGGQQLASQSKAEDSLSVSLPADLSVENPPISLWPPLSSPQNSSSQMISHFPGGPPSHFPFYEMNPMMGSPIFAFGPHEESSSTQSQSQKSSMPAWQQCHSGVDSFYGPPTGFTGHFITPPGGIPGVQGAPHMVVYNHFAPVGQFGLSFMGTTYIPSGKQPDWKNNPASAIGEGDVNNLNIAASQRNSTNMPAQIQHLAPGPGSPLLPMPSPLAMFDVSPFQSTPDMSQARWSHVPASPLQSVTASMPLQQQTESALHSQFSQGPPVDQSLTNNRFSESQTSTPSDSSRKFPVATDPTITQLPDELGLVEPSSSTIAAASAQHVTKGLSPAVADSGKTDVQNGGGIKINGQSTNPAFKAHSSQQNNILSSQQYGNSGYNNQRTGGVSQKNNVGGWTPRRMGFQGRNLPMATSKMKQIYVAKQTNNETSTSSR